MAFKAFPLPRPVAGKRALRPSRAMALLLAFTAPAHMLIIGNGAANTHGVDGSGNAIFGWDNVATNSPFEVVYLGNGWGVAPHHTFVNSLSTIVFGAEGASNSYGVAAGSVVQVNNPEGGTTDMDLFSYPTKCHYGTVAPTRTVAFTREHTNRILANDRHREWSLAAWNKCLLASEYYNFNVDALVIRLG